MADENGETNTGEVKAVAEDNEHEGDHVMGSELSDIASGFLNAEHKHNDLVKPVACLHDVVEFEDRRQD